MKPGGFQIASILHPPRRGHNSFASLPGRRLEHGGIAAPTSPRRVDTGGGKGLSTALAEPEQTDPIREPSRRHSRDPVHDRHRDKLLERPSGGRTPVSTVESHEYFARGLRRDGWATNAGKRRPTVFAPYVLAPTCARGH